MKLAQNLKWQIDKNMETTAYILFAGWCATLAAGFVCMLVYVWRSTQQSPELNQKDPFFQLLSAYPKIIRIAWWTMLGITILSGIIKIIISS